MDHVHRFRWRPHDARPQQHDRQGAAAQEAGRQVGARGHEGVAGEDRPGAVRQPAVRAAQAGRIRSSHDAGRHFFFLLLDFNCYSGLCWHKNWFADLNWNVGVSRDNI